jgi:hypothetical protein
MEVNNIVEVRIDDAGRLCVVPEIADFAYIYRAGMEVSWDESGEFLYSPSPREWTYVRWFEQTHPLVSLGFTVGGIAFQVWAGRNGNDWRRNNLKKNTYTYVTSVPARSAKAAQVAHPSPQQQGVS